jgi:hypothetical protein
VIKVTRLAVWASSGNEFLANIFANHFADFSLSLTRDRVADLGGNKLANHFLYWYGDVEG